MKTTAMYTLSMLLLLSGKSAIADDCGQVAYTPFEALLYGAQNEQSIATDAFQKSFISYKKLQNLLITQFSNKPSDYNSRDTRVLITLRDRNYYIDVKGNIRNGSKFSKIDISKFESMLSSSCHTEKND